MQNHIFATEDSPATGSTHDPKARKLLENILTTNFKGTTGETANEDKTLAKAAADLAAAANSLRNCYVLGAIDRPGRYRHHVFAMSEPMAMPAKGANRSQGMAKPPVTSSPARYDATPHAIAARTARIRPQGELLKVCVIS